MKFDNWKGTIVIALIVGAFAAVINGQNGAYERGEENIKECLEDVQMIGGDANDYLMCRYE